MTTLLAFALALSSFACFRNPDQSGSCGSGGTLAEASGTTACVFRKSIQVTGFQCPLDFPMLSTLGDFYLCATMNLPVPLQEELLKSANLGGEDAQSTLDAQPSDSDSQISADSSAGDSNDVGSVTPDSGAGDTTADVQTQGDVLRLDPGSIVLVDPGFDFPLGRIRGYDSQNRSCVELTITRLYDDTYNGAECLDGFRWQSESKRFRLIVLPNHDAPCDAADFELISATDNITAITGCYAFAGVLDAVGNPDTVAFSALTLSVSGVRFVGTIIVDDRVQLQPPPTVFTMRYISDIPEDAYVQLSDDLGFPTWVKVRKKGETTWRRLFTGCDVPVCGQGGAVCGVSATIIRSFTGGTPVGELSLVWDGRFHVYDDGNQCLGSVDAEPGEYEAEFCYSWTVDDPKQPTQLTNPQCETIPFTYPTMQVLHTVDNGG
ncbi:MAG: hypothetical protein KC609_26910 [Myxococcales bacterium]|nr:hypothetical protein [Myxococcales bacterium]